MGLVILAGCASVPSQFNGTDIAWIQLMIPMDEQLLPLLELAPGRAEFAAQIRPELDRLRHLRDQAGLPATNIHAGHDMPGFVTAADLAAAGAGSAQLIGTLLREHTDQVAQLAQSERDGGSHPEVVALAGNVLTRAQHWRNTLESALQSNTSRE